MHTDTWYRIAEIEQNIFLIEEPGHVNSFLIVGTESSVLIDSGTGLSDIRTAVSPLLRENHLVLNTHWHFDHIGGNAQFEKVGISPLEKDLIQKGLSNKLLKAIYINPCLQQGIPLPDGFEAEDYQILGCNPKIEITDGYSFDLGGRTLTAIATPGHTRGSISFLDDLTESLFCGDFVYRGTLYAHFADSDRDQYVQTLDRLANPILKFKRIFPAHNEPVLERSFLESVRKGFNQILSGTKTSQQITDWGMPSDFYQFGEFDVLIKPKGSKGITLVSDLE